MISYDAEIHVSRQKEIARRAAASYPDVSHLANGHNGGNAVNGGNAAVHRRALAGLGGALVALGLRLQGELDQRSAAPELADTLGLARNEPCPDC
jgi:hypothetical protein